ncbi:MAG: hypothetical protein LH610_06545 [Sphingomonas bacterium]|nr:hypothetical protein [Sphingomonas bacterium]
MTNQLQIKRFAPMCRDVILSRLFAMFIALSLLVGPLAMNRAMAATPAASHSQMTDDGHCQPADEGKADKAMSKPCCAAMCATQAVVPESSPSEQVFTRLPAIAVPMSFHREVLGELATPPPRFS